MANGTIKRQLTIQTSYFWNTSSGHITTDIQYNKFISAVPSNWNGLLVFAQGTASGGVNLRVKNGDSLTDFTDTRAQIAVTHYVNGGGKQQFALASNRRWAA